MRLDEITRRGFLKGVGATAATAGMSNLAKAKDSNWKPFLNAWSGISGVDYCYDTDSVTRKGNDIFVKVRMDDSKSKQKVGDNLKNPQLLKINTKDQSWANCDSLERCEVMRPITPDDSEIISLVHKLK